MNPRWTEITLAATGAKAVADTQAIQRLWSGYGTIVRCQLEGSAFGSVVVKHVHWPEEQTHPRGWNTDRSHARKVRSYQVESEWYRSYAMRCSDACRVPRCLALETHGNEVFMVLEDLNASGFSGRRNRLDRKAVESGLSWLANFHATFMHEPAKGLWNTGTYWHLETRPDELAALDHAELKAAASAIDQKLKASRFQTIVHGDAKLANFCFSDTGAVAAVDFQYVGGGCGMKDVAYFLGSCLSEDECELHEAEYLDAYFSALAYALSVCKPHVDATKLELDWRALYPIAWTDFLRFLLGWSPGHWKIHGYSQRLAREVLENL